MKTLNLYGTPADLAENLLPGYTGSPAFVVHGSMQLDESTGEIILSTYELSDGTSWIVYGSTSLRTERYVLSDRIRYSIRSQTWTYLNGKPVRLLDQPAAETAADAAA